MKVINRMLMKLFMATQRKNRSLFCGSPTIAMKFRMPMK
ncbi:hypothetical protein UUU_08900 [Klebsiella pneumoniae subsp. pneumoniae DSM 30104 = JCM 1662 = NBRC 14940]|nr:hypothetical protein UUU_08900 [Klebsiella pneumoniae subsp. pneumoniae DSM 30104 = JCM 1662 = NBRC 14940]